MGCTKHVRRSRLPGQSIIWPGQSLTDRQTDAPSDTRVDTRTGVSQTSGRKGTRGAAYSLNGRACAGAARRPLPRRGATPRGSEAAPSERPAPGSRGPGGTRWAQPAGTVSTFQPANGSCGRSPNRSQPQRPALAGAGLTRSASRQPPKGDGREPETPPAGTPGALALPWQMVSRTAAPTAAAAAAALTGEGKVASSTQPPSLPSQSELPRSKGPPRRTRPRVRLRRMRAQAPPPERAGRRAGQAGGGSFPAAIRRGRGRAAPLASLRVAGEQPPVTVLLPTSSALSPSPVPAVAHAHSCAA